MDTNTLNTQWTDENIIDLVRKLRNDLIKDFLDERMLNEYMATQFRVKDLSPVKLEFIKKELKELLISPGSHFFFLVSKSASLKCPS